MSKLLFQAWLDDFQVVPYTRMTGPGRFTERAQRYLKNRESMAWLFRKAANEQKLYEPIAFDCLISFEVHRVGNRRSDYDNLGKSVNDALEQAQIVKNDNVIVGAKDIRIRYGKTHNAVFVSLFEVTD